MAYAIGLVALAGLAAYAYMKAQSAQSAQNAQISSVSGILNFSGSDMSGVTTGPVAPSNITNDPSTWPSGDRIWDICHAIAYAEGANRAGSAPDRLNNPGDISDWASEYGSEYTDGSDVTHFPDKWTGWQKLYDKVSAIANGQSSVYSPSMSWIQIAQHWAGNWQSWVENVTSHLGVSQQDTLGAYVNG
jgi:hypothetical protein